LVLDVEGIGHPRSKVLEALQAEGVPVSAGYANIHLLPLFQKKIAYGNRGFPWSGEVYTGHVKYDKGICPVAEDLHDRTFLKIGMCAYQYTDRDIQMIVEAFRKVWKNLDQLQ